MPDGARRYISVSGEPTFDSGGRFTGYRGIGRDITKQKRIQQLLKLDHAVTLRLAEAHTASGALTGALEAICDSLRWDCAELWAHDETAGALRRFAHWAAPGEPEAQRFVEASRDVVFRPGMGLVGTVWQSGEPRVDTMADARALRGDRETGPRGGFFLVRAGGRRRCHEFTARHARAGQVLQTWRSQDRQFQRSGRARGARERSPLCALTNLSDWY
jgi:hypothetical protein